MFLDELIADLYEKLGVDFRANLRSFQICKGPVLYSYENGEVWRPSRYDGSQTAATDFSGVPRPGDAYKQTRTIHTPRLEPYEEFPVVRAKFRPVVLLVADPPPIDVPQIRGGGRVNRHLCIVAPCYSVADAMGRAKFPESFLNRVRRLEFPQFMFLPQSAVMTKDSLLRLDSIQHVFHSELEASQWCLSSDIRKILAGQLCHLFAGEYAGEYQIARDMLLEQKAGS